jgi:hypothetical protein
MSFVEDPHKPLELAAIEPGKRDADLAKEYRARIATALEPVLAVMNEAKKEHGLTINFGIGYSQFDGKRIITGVDVARIL